MTATTLICAAVAIGCLAGGAIGAALNASRRPCHLCGHVPAWREAHVHSYWADRMTDPAATAPIRHTRPW